MPYSLLKRTQIFEKKFRGSKLSVYMLRKIYKQHKIRLRVLNNKLQLPPAKLQQIEDERMIVFPRIAELIQRKARVAFIDETVFTTRQV